MKRICVLVTCLMLLAGTAHAELVAGWDMYGQPGDQVSTPGYGAGYVTVADMVRGAGLTAVSGSNSFNSSGWLGSYDDDYIEFGFSVATGYAVTLDELWIGTRSSGTGPGTIGVYTSLDGYTDPVDTIVQNNTDYSNSIIDLACLGEITGDFSVRLYEVGDLQADGSGATTNSGTFRIADYYDGGYIDTHFEGAVSPVPVPGALWLAGSALVSIVGLRRKQTRVS